MPVRSLNSSVLKWPDAETVGQAVRRWAQEVVRDRSGVVRIGYYGSYARGDWGVGSDLDLVVVVEASGEPFWRRPAGWDITKLPVPADLIVYTIEEWCSFDRQTQMYRTLTEETVWVYIREDGQ